MMQSKRSMLVLIMAISVVLVATGVLTYGQASREWEDDQRVLEDRLRGADGVPESLVNDDYRYVDRKLFESEEVVVWYRNIANPRGIPLLERPLVVSGVFVEEKETITHIPQDFILPPYKPQLISPLADHRLMLVTYSVERPVPREQALRDSFPAIVKVRDLSQEGVPVVLEATLQTRDQDGDLGVLVNTSHDYRFEMVLYRQSVSENGMRASAERRWQWDDDAERWKEVGEKGTGLDNKQETSEDDS